MEIDRRGDRPDVWYRTHAGGNTAVWVRIAGKVLIAKTDDFDSGSTPGNVVHDRCHTLGSAWQTWPEDGPLWQAVMDESEAIGDETPHFQHARFFSEPY